MSNGYHLLFLPFVFVLVIPIILYSRYHVPWGTEFHFYALMIFSSFLAIWNTIELWRIFIKRIGNYKKFQNALRNKTILKYSILIYGVLFFGSLGVDLISTNTDYLSLSENEDVLLARIFFISLFFLFIPIIPMVTMIMQSEYFKGKAFAYFTLGLNSKNDKKQDNYQSGIYAYNEFLSERLGLKLNHLDEIESYILTVDELIADKEISDMLKTFDETVGPAKKICSWFKIPEKEIFVNIPPFEYLDKWHKVSFIIPILILIISYFNLTKP